MTVQEIKNLALLLCGQRDIPDAYVFMYINKAMNELATKFDEAGKKEVTYLYGVDEVWTDLPDRCTSVKRVSKNNIPVTDYLIENGQIKFPTVGEHKVEYIAMQDRVTKLSDTPSINELFHEALAYYVAYREMTRIFMHEDLTQGNNKILLLSEYNREAELANTKLRTMKKSRQRVKYAPMI
jgi:hypothetical protein